MTTKTHIGKLGIGLWDVIAALSFLSIFFIPFNENNGPNFLGEMKGESAVMFLIPAAILLFIAVLINRKFHIPYRNLIFQFLVLLVAWFIVATLLNINNVAEYYFKRTSGIERFFRQFISLILSAGVFFLVYYNVFRRQEPLKLFYRIRRVFLYSFMFVCAYGFLEILVVKLKMFGVYPVLKLFGYFPFTSVNLDFHLDRISSVTFEPPALASYLFTVAGWMFSYMITGRGLKKYLPGIGVVILAFFSGSRAGLVIMVVQILIFFVLLVKKRSYHQTFIRILGGILVLGIIGGIIKGKDIYAYVEEKITSFAVDEGTHQISNMSRFGLQYAMYRTWLDYPVSGVGFGQQTYVAKTHYPRWSTRDNWEYRLKYLNEEDPRFPPGYNIYLRILAESGIIGFFIFISLLVLIFHACFKLLKAKTEYQIVLFCILISMTGFYLNWLKMDSFRIFGFWINLALLLRIMDQTKFTFRRKKVTIPDNTNETKPA